MIKIGKIQKINEKNLPYDKVVKFWENCNKERIELQKENHRLQQDSKHWRSEAEKYERFLQNKETLYTSEILKLVESIYLGNIPKALSYSELIMQKAEKNENFQFAKAIEKRLDGSFLLDAPVVCKNENRPEKP